MITCKELILKEGDGEIRTFYDLQAEFSYSSFVSLLCLLSHWGGTVGGMQITGGSKDQYMANLEQSPDPTVEVERIEVMKVKLS